MKSLLIALTMMFGFAAQAQDVGIIAGYRADSADAETSGLTVEGKGGFQFGAVAKFEVHNAWQVRSGFIYTQRAYEVKSGGVSLADTKFTYFEVPANILYKFSDYGGAFIGPAVAFNVSKNCGDADCEGVSSAPLFLQFGASFKFAPQLGAEIYYEMGMSKIANELKSPRAVMANFMITFD